MEYKLNSPKLNEKDENIDHEENTENEETSLNTQNEEKQEPKKKNDSFLV